MAGELGAEVFIITRRRPVGHANKNDELSRRLYNLVLVEHSCMRLFIDEMHMWRVNRAKPLRVKHTKIEHVRLRCAFLLVLSSIFDVKFIG